LVQVCDLMSALTVALEECARWREPRSVPGNPFRLRCSLSPPAAIEEVAKAWPESALPPGAADLWRLTRTADLFVDADFGQWGLRLLNPEASATRTRKERALRPTDYEPNDVVLGEFLGDQDLLVIGANGSVLVALPLDPRQDWYRPATNLSRFLIEFVAKKGAKFWELPHARS
jgi:hypothetical protein